MLSFDASGKFPQIDISCRRYERAEGSRRLKGFSISTEWRVAVISVWALLIAAGLGILLRYSNIPGILAQPSMEWPADAAIKPVAGRSTLLVFVHPQCPCSRASLGELARIIACCKDQIETTVFFSIPPGTPPDFRRSDLWDTAAAIPTVRVMADVNAMEARHFGARTSGQVLLYDRGRHLAFNGGITAFRGHSGDNDGRDAIESLLRGQHPRLRTTPVFGCALFGES